MRKEQYLNKEKINTVPAIKKTPKREYYSVSLQQEGVWLQAKINPGSTVWNTSHSWRYQGRLDIEALKKAIQELIHRHASLRTNFQLKKDKILQVIHENFSLDSFFRFFDISSCPGNQKESIARSIEETAAKETYNLAAAPLIRFTWIRFHENDHLLVISKHHIISDATSRQIIWKEWVSLYNTYTANKPHQLATIDIQYHDYAAWQQEFRETPYYQKQKEYWLSQLLGKESAPLPVLDLPTDLPRQDNENKKSKTSTYSINLDQQLAVDLRSFSLRNRVTFSSVFLLGFYIFLNKYAGQDDMVIGTLYRGRNIDKQVLDKIIGLFANHVAMRLHMDENASVKELLAEVNKKTRQAYENQDYLYEDLVRTLHPERTALHAPIYQVVFNMLKITGMDIEPAGLVREQWQEFAPDSDISSQYDLSLYVRDEIKKITLMILYTKDRFFEETINRMMGQYTNILLKMILQPGIKLKDVEIITGEEKQRILYEFNNTDANYPKHKTLHRLFEEQMEQTPDHIALVGAHELHELHEKGTRGLAPLYNCGEIQLSYSELNRKSNQLAYLLKGKGVKPDTIVGLMVKRSVEMIIGILGILKAGGAYLPIDLGYPEERIDFMLKDSGAEILLKDNDFTPEAFNNRPKGTSSFGISPQGGQLAYVIYTSGSTGKPKGVMVHHQAVHNFIKGMTENIDFAPGKTILALTTISFDIFILETMLPLLQGLRVVIADERQQLHLDLLEELIVKTGIDMLQATPTRMQMFTHRVNSSRPCCLKNLEEIMVGGEPFPVKLLKDLQQSTPARIYNMYGPTETTVWSTMKELTHAQEITIGQPIANTQIYILDKNYLPQPIGVIGELYIGGDGLARGYINRPELTSEKYCLRRVRGADSLLTLKGTGKRNYMSHMSHMSYIYLTGDLARWLPDGNIECLGRVDNQVKIRGNRIELGEIESELNKHPGVRESVVTAISDETSGKSLCAYVVSSGEGDFNVLEFRDHLNQRLPDYMVPSYFVQLEEIPRTSNGKLDRRSLPMPGGLNNARSFYEPPTPGNDIQQKLVSVWQEVLRSGKIGINDNFFVIGGDSIKAIRIASRLSAFGYRLDIGVLFRHPTIKDLWKQVEAISEKIPQEPVTGNIASTPIREWFIKQNFTNKHHWNMAVMLYREEGIEKAILQNVFKRLAEHHDLLRAVLAPDERGLIIKGIHPPEVPLETIDLVATDDRALEKRILSAVNRIQAGIDLFSAPLIKIGLFKTRHGDHLLIVIHHLVVDGISWRILLEDISRGYQQAKAGKKIQFPAKTHSFKRWAEEINAYSRSDKLLQEYDYWKEICAKGITELSPAAKGETGKPKDYYRYKIQLHEEESSSLLNEVNRAYHTEINDIMLSALGLAIRDCFGLKKITIQLEGHGREKILGNIDISRTVGWFTTQFPILLEVQENDKENEEDRLSIHIRHTKESLRKIPNKGIGFGILRYISELPEKDRYLLEIEPEICFNYLGQFDEDLTRSGFKQSPYGTGNTRSLASAQPYKININGRVVNREVSFTFSCDTNTYNKQQIETLARGFKHHLQRIIKHCREIEEPVHTPGDYDAKNLDFLELEAIHQQFGKANTEKIYDLSPMQEGMLFHYLLDPLRQAYLVQLVYLLEGEIHQTLVKESYQQLMDKYDVFRTAFIYKNIKQPRQVVLNNRKKEFRFHDLSGSNDPGQMIENIKKQDRERGFDLQDDILMRITLIKTHQDRYALLMTYHHIIMDGWSSNLLLKDFITIYYQLKTGKPLESGMANPYPYLDYIKWLHQQDLPSASHYWQSYLSGFDQVTRIQTLEGVHGDTMEYKEQNYTAVVEPEIKGKLSQLAQQWNVTPNNILQAVWSLILQRYTGADDLVFGNVISGRNIPIESIEQVIGLFINTIPMRVKINSEASSRQLTRQIQENLLESQRYGFLPLGEIQAQAGVEDRLLEHLYIYENYPINKELRSPQLAGTVGFKITKRYSIEHTNYHLNLLIIPRTDLRLQFQYNENVYHPSFVSALARHIRCLLREMVLYPDQPAATLAIVTDEEKQQLLMEF
ncbi:MAG: amino acid adenylation domain-containing protein, partial [Candidatus Aminicenantes bacterium]